MKKKTGSKRPLKRHLFLMKILRFLLGWIFVLRFNFQHKKIKLPETPSLVLMNHNSDYDPIFAGIIFRDHLYFVTSEHLIGQTFFGRLIRFIFDPIIRVKGTTESRAAREILTTIRKGMNVCLFAEGDRSYNGETGYISPATGKLVKRSGAALVTYKLRGGYFSTPRWAKGIRRGLIKGEVVNFYSKKQVESLSNEEISSIIAKDLYVNAYEDQSTYNVRYIGNKKEYAVGIELALYICPRCKRIGTIKSSTSRFYCDCGLEMQYTEDGWIEGINGESSEFNSILEWDRWQLKELSDRLKTTTDNSQEIFHDDMQTLYEFELGGQRTEVITGRLSFYRDRLEFNDSSSCIVFYFNNIDDIEVTGRMTVTFVTKDKKLFEFRSPTLRSAKKYRDSFRILKSIGA